MDKDKKKIMIIAALAVVMLTVGVFQFTAGGEPAPKPKSEAKATAKKDATENTAPTSESGVEVTVEGDAKPSGVQGLVSLALPVRDPFTRGTVSELVAVPTITPPTPQPVPQPAPTRPRPTRMPGGQGTVPPFPVNGMGGLPSVDVSPGTPLRQPGEFSYRVSGVILGAKPAVVFVDDSGAQKLVQLGSALDGDSRVTGVRENAVTVRHRGKTMTLSVGGTSQ